MQISDVINRVQEHFTDGLVIVIGSGLSAAEGLPGMPALADYLISNASELSGSDAVLWAKIATALAAKEGLEAALLKHQPTETLESWLAKKTSALILPKEREVIAEVVRGERILRLTTFLLKILKSSSGLPILTPNYDRLIEVACEMAGFHVDTTAIGQYAASFDHSRSCMASCRGIVSRGKTSVLDHFPRAVVLKPHGSFDWYRNDSGAVRCAMELDAERLIITPGLNKYKAGYSAPFDKHRELANNHINQSARLLIIGYGFNDDHLQTHLVKRIQDGTPTIILSRTATTVAKDVSERSPNCVCLSKPIANSGVSVISKGVAFEHTGTDIWDIGTLAKELLG